MPNTEQTANPTRKVQSTLDMERPASPTSVDQHPSMLLDDTTITLLFGDYAKQTALNTWSSRQSTLTQACQQSTNNSARAQPSLDGKENTATRSDDWSQGYQDIAGTNTMHFIPVHKIPPGRKPTYYRPVCADQPNKENPIRVRGTVGGNLIDYPSDISTKTSGLVAAKIMFNGTHQHTRRPLPSHRHQGFLPQQRNATL